ncbi:restriction endonuclease-like protein [Oscillochloris sp. ZM17-4]|uniref:DUF2357 domain-containing protein n=1 Tax=Oscillochloris sp. ZM17-4 TaxID=2866714 RepID=UPI001C737FB7|nr:DUF2357 domain-containing protein [Oscillochloris sp. ZM17-4]MBX0329251.1 restriction endonuclease-like protein [Oscillochloris sp. ZM17-4]
MQIADCRLNLQSAICNLQSAIAMELLLDGQPLGSAAAIDEWRAAELSCLPPEGAALRLWLGDAELEPFLRPGDPAWRWRWVAQGGVGGFALVLRAGWPDGRAEELRATLRVRPRKLDEDRYRALLDDLQRLGRALVFALGGGAAPGAWSPEPDAGPPAPAEDLAGLLGPDLDRFLAAAERIARRPPDRLRPGVELVEPGQARDLSALDRARIDASALAGESGDVAAKARQLSAIPERRPAASHDSYENRLLKRALAALARRAALLQATPGLPEPARRRVADAVDQLRGLRGRPFLADVAALSQFAGPTPRLQRDPDYRAVFRMWQLLRRRPLVQWDAATLAIPVQDLPRLYERWCAARVALALLDMPGLTLAAQDLARQDDDDDMAWGLRLAEGGALLELEGAAGARLALRYQARYAPGGAPLRSLDRHTRVPDLSLEIRRPDAPPQVVMLDAKYRLDASGGVPEDALADAYSYLGSIGAADGARAAVAVALLYPGLGAAEIYPSGVAALPLLPGDDGELAAWITEALRV